MKTHKSVKERENGLREIQSEPNPTQTDTTQVMRTKGRSHFLLTSKRGWCGCLYQWVCVCQVWQRSQIRWHYFLGIHENLLISACTTSHALEPRRSILSTEGIHIAYLWENQSVLAKRKTHLYNLLGNNFTRTGNISITSSHFLRSVSRCFTQSCFFDFLLSSKDFCSSLTFTDVYLQACLNWSTSAKEMDNSPGGGKINQ